MNSFFRCNSKNRVGGLLTLIAVTSLQLMHVEGCCFTNLSSLIAAVWAAMVFIRQSEQECYILHGLSQMSTYLEKGHMSYRITQIPDHTELGAVARCFNNALDQVETYMQKAASCFKTAQNHIYYRKPQYNGLSGSFVSNLKQIELSLQIMSDHHFHSLRKSVFSYLGQMKTENLISNLHKTQEDLTTVNKQMDKVEGITSRAFNIAAESRGSLNQVMEQLNSIINKIEHMQSSSTELNEAAMKLTPLPA